jgi:hypothetical protein
VTSMAISQAAQGQDITEHSPFDQRLHPAFARHETFHPRFGWLKKGYDAACRQPDIFLLPDAPAVLGVGKNMVRAIRYWCSAYKILEEVPNNERPRLRDAVPTDFGNRLLASQGWDPYLERAGSLWLLHWHLFSSPCTAPAWFIAFNEFRKPEFTDQDLLSELKSFRNGQEGWQTIVDGSLRKDVECLLRMFAGSASSREVLEDSIDSPFLELDLIRRTPGAGKHYSFNTGQKPNLPDAVVVYACLDFAEKREGGARTIGLSTLSYSSGSPGTTFKLTETALVSAIERYAANHSFVYLSDVAGAHRFIFDEEPDRLKWRVLTSYYRASEKAA